MRGLDQGFDPQPEQIYGAARMPTFDVEGPREEPTADQVKAFEKSSQGKALRCNRRRRRGKGMGSKRCSGVLR